eukprot:00482_5
MVCFGVPCLFQCGWRKVVRRASALQHDQIINHHHTSCTEFGLNKEFGLHSYLSVFVQLWPCVFICLCCWTCASSGLLCVRGIPYNTLWLALDATTATKLV